MAGDIVVSGGGSLAVATGDLFDACDRLGRLYAVLLQCAADLDQVNSAVTRGQLSRIDAPLSSIRAEEALDDTAKIIRTVAPNVQRLRVALLIAAETYGRVEHSLAQLSQGVAARFGGLFGRSLPFFALVLLPATLSVGAGAAVTCAVLPPVLRQRALAALPKWLMQNSAPLSDPRVVQFIRLSAMSIDDVGGGLLMVPPEVMTLLGDEGLRVLGFTTAAGMLVRLSRPSGLFTETPITISRVGRQSITTPVEGYGGRIDRIPQGRAQIRIDRYEELGRPDRFEVYIGGTKDFGVLAATEPWDMTSNLNGVAGQESGASSAVRQAMADAGVTATSPIVFTGHSQGGLIAANLAASGDFSTMGLLTVGAPVGQIDVPAAVSFVAIEHTDDLVPATGGTWASTDPVLVRRHYFAGRAVDTGNILPAHQLDAYRNTAELVDASRERRLMRALEQMDSIAVGASSRVTSTLYRGVRTVP